MSLKSVHLNDCLGKILGKINKYICDLRPRYYFVILSASRRYSTIYSFPSTSSVLGIGNGVLLISKFTRSVAPCSDSWILVLFYLSHTQPCYVCLINAKGTTTTVKQFHMKDRYSSAG